MSCDHGCLINTKSPVDRVESTYSPVAIYFPQFANLSLFSFTWKALDHFLRPAMTSDDYICVIIFKTPEIAAIYEQTREQLLEVDSSVSRLFIFSDEHEAIRVAHESSLIKTQGATFLLTHPDGTTIDSILKETPYRAVVASFVPFNLSFTSSTNNGKRVVNELRCLFVHDHNLPRANVSILREPAERMLMSYNVTVDKSDLSLDNCSNLSHLSKQAIEFVTMFQQTWSVSELTRLFVTKLAPSAYFVFSDLTFLEIVQHYTVLSMVDVIRVSVMNEQCDVVTYETLESSKTFLSKYSSYLDGSSLDGFAFVFQSWLYNNYDFFESANNFKRSLFASKASTQSSKPAGLSDLNQIVLCEMLRSYRKCTKNDGRLERGLNLWYPWSVFQQFLSNAQHPNKFNLYHWSDDNATEITLSDRFYDNHYPFIGLSHRVIE